MNMSKYMANRAKARKRHMSKYYVLVVSDTVMRVLSRHDYNRIKEEDPIKFKTLNFLEFDSMQSAMNHVSKQFGFTCMPAAHA